MTMQIPFSPSGHTFTLRAVGEVTIVESATGDRVATLSPVNPKSWNGLTRANFNDLRETDHSFSLTYFTRASAMARVAAFVD